MSDKLYVVVTQGHYLGGYIVVIAPNEKTALKRVRKDIDLSDLGRDELVVYDVREYELSDTVLVWNGDY